jgi:hypothetical protein
MQEPTSTYSRLNNTCTDVGVDGTDHIDSASVQIDIDDTLSNRTEEK